MKRKSSNAKHSLTLYWIHLRPSFHSSCSNVLSKSFPIILQPLSATFISTTTPQHPISQHFKPLPYYNTLYCHTYTTILQLLHVSQCLRLSVTLLASCFPWDQLLLSPVNQSCDTSRIAQSRTFPASASPFNYTREVHMIMACKCISILARLQLPSASPNMVDYCLHVHTIMASNSITNLARSWPLSWNNYRINDHFQTHPITACKCISELLDLGLQVNLSVTWSRPPSESSISHDYGLQLHLTMASKCIAKLTWLQPPNASLSSHVIGVWVPLIFQLELGHQVHWWKLWCNHNGVIMSLLPRCYSCLV